MSDEHDDCVFGLLRRERPYFGLIAAELLLLRCATAVAVILYVLIRPLSREGALLAIFFDVVSIAFEAAVAMYMVAGASR